MNLFIAFLFINQLLLLKMDGTVASPAGILNGVWFIACALFNTGVIPFAPASSKLLWVLFSTFGCFYFGYYFYRFLFRHNIAPPSKPTRSEEKGAIDLVLLFLLLVLSIRTFSVFFGLYFRFGGLSGIFENGDAIYAATRFGEWSPGIPVVLPIEPLSAFFVAYNFIRTRRFGFISCVVVLQILVLTTLLQSRYMLMLSIFAFIGPIASCVRDVKIVTVGRLFAFLGVVAAITASRGLTSGVSSESGLSSLPIAAQLGSVIYYISCGIGGLNTYLEIGVDEYSGVYSLNGLAQMLEIFFGIDGIALKYEEVTYYTPVPTITATALRFIIDDFGFYFIPFLIFIGISLARLWSTASSLSSGNIWITSIFSMIFGYSFFGWLFFINGFWLYMLTSFLLIVFIRSNVIRSFRILVNERIIA